MLILIKLLTWMASPLGALIWGLALASLMAFLKRRKTATAFAAIAIAQLIAFSTSFVADALFGSLENRARLLQADHERAAKSLAAKPAGAIVVLGGSMNPAYPPRRPYPDLNDAADRVWHAARLYQQGVATRIIVSGGKGPGLEDREDIASEAASMRELLMDLGVPSSAIVIEASSRTTRENAEFTKKWIAGESVALVTSAFHMPRAYASFQNIGITAMAFPTDFRVAPEADPGWSRWLPSASNLQRSETALKEYLALAVRY